MNSAHDNVNAIESNGNVLKKSNYNYLFSIIFLSFQFRMSLKNGDNGKSSASEGQKLDFIPVVLTTQKTSPEEITPTVVELK